MYPTYQIKMYWWTKLYGDERSYPYLRRVEPVAISNRGVGVEFVDCRITIRLFVNIDSETQKRWFKPVTTWLDRLYPYENQTVLK